MTAIDRVRSALEEAVELAAGLPIAKHVEPHRVAMEGWEADQARRAANPPQNDMERAVDQDVARRMLAWSESAAEALESLRPTIIETMDTPTFLLWAKEQASQPFTIGDEDDEQNETDS